MSAFNLEAFEELFGGSDSFRQNIVFMARIAESAERYDDMCQIMRKLVDWASEQSPKQRLTVEERNLLSVAFKNVIGARRASWRTLNADGENNTEELINEYKRQIEAELETICQDVLDLLENKLAENESNQDEESVFYLKMAADYYRYLAECVVNKGYKDNATDHYKKAFEIAEEALPPTHPIRLGLALNYSVCLYEIVQDKTKACELAKSAFDEAISKLDKLEESDYKDSTLIMQLLRDNLTLWTSTSETEDNDEEN